MQSILSVSDPRDAFGLMLLERIDALEDRAFRVEAELDESATKEILNFVRYYAYRHLKAGAMHYYSYLLDQLRAWSACDGFTAKPTKDRDTYMLRYMRRDEWELVPRETHAAIADHLSSMPRDKKKAFADAWLFQLVGDIEDAETRKAKYFEILSK